MMDPAAFYLAGAPAHGAEPLAVHRPYDGGQVGLTTWATPDQVERAVAAAESAAPQVAAMPARVRAAALGRVSRGLAARAGEVANLITAESGKPIRWARIEVTRAASVFQWAAEEARRFAGELQRLDTDPAGDGRLALVRRFPRGPVLGITPFNFPLNLVAHKVAPALAAGAPIIVKPAPATPLSALLLGELLAETELPPGSFSMLPATDEHTRGMVTDPRLPVVSFTGSAAVGEAIRVAAPHKHITLELGGNAAALICEDWSSQEDLAWAARRIATFANYQAGQSCIAVQRVFVHERHHPVFLAELAAAIRTLRTGNPQDEAVEIGPLISEQAAARVERWVREAVTAGATVVVGGGQRQGASYPATLLTDVPATARVAAEEVFGPVLVVAPVATDAAGLAAINDSAYGLQAGVFTRRLPTAFHAHRELAVGGVIIGDVPSYRADQVPYGGQKGSGNGREGVASAMEDYTQPRVLVLTDLSL